MNNPGSQDNGSILPGNWRQLALLGGTLLLAVAGLNIASWQTPAALSPDSHAPADTTPDIVITAPRIEKFDETGLRKSWMQGSRLQHYDKDNFSLVDNPVVNFMQSKPGAKAMPWQLKANTAKLLHDTQKIDLQGQVLLFSDATPGGRTEIATEQLLLDTGKEYAETDKAVTIRARRSEAHAAGLKADLANERLMLPARVKETHESRRR